MPTDQQLASGILARIERIQKELDNDPRTWWFLSKVYGQAYIFGMSDEKRDELYREARDVLNAYLG